MTDEMTRVAYCPHCGDDREIKQTVPWQPDLCRTCGGNIEKDT